MFIVIFIEHLRYAGVGWEEVIESSQQPLTLVELFLLFNGSMMSRESDLSKVTVGPRILNPFQVLLLTSSMTLNKSHNPFGPQFPLW